MLNRAHSDPLTTAHAIEEVLDAFRRRMHLDGADIELIGLDGDGRVELHLSGRHAGCPVAVATLQSAVEEALRDRVPDVKSVVLLK